MRRSGRFSQALQQLFQGRYGADQLTRFLSYAALALLILALCVRAVGSGVLSNVLYFLALALLIWLYFRCFSRNFAARQRENQRYLRMKSTFLGFFRCRRDRFQQRKEYAFFRCPGCRQIVRVPRGKGKLRITCRRCGYSFDKKT